MTTSEPRGGGWKPPPEPGAGAPEQPAAEKTPTTGGIVGEVRGLQQRSEDRDQSVWDFRIERFDAVGNRLPPVPVQMRSSSFAGGINDGDRVEVSGRWAPGETLRPRRLRNLTTGALVGSRYGSGVGLVVAIVVAAAFGAFFIWLAVQFATGKPHTSSGAPGLPAWVTPTS